MAEIVDSIVAELIVRADNYVRDFRKATEAVDGHTAALKRLQAADAKANRPASNNRASASKAAAAEIKRAAKETADAEKAEAKAAAAAVKAAEKEKQAALKATAKEQAAAAKAAADAAKVQEEAAARAVAAAEREAATRARLASVVARAVSSKRVTPGTGRMNTSGAVVQPGDAVRPSFIPPSALNGGNDAAAAELAAQKDIDFVRRDIAINEARLVGLQGKEREEVERTLAYLRTYNTLKAAGVAETEAQVLAEKQLTLAQSRRSRGSQREGLGGANQFALGATRGRFGYSFSPGALAGVGVAAAVYGGVEAVQSGINYATELSDTAEQVGLTTKQLQVYQEAAKQAGVSSDQFRGAVQHLNSYLGQAQQGDQQAAKTFDRLNVSIKDAGSAGDILPTLIDRISKIPDAAKRAALETRLFGETGARLDGLLGQGSAKVDALAKSMKEAGSILSDADIKTLKDASVVLGDLKQQLQVDLSRVVANNKDAILGLARAFAEVADKALKALSAISRIRNQNIYDQAKPGSSDQRAAFDSLITDPQGRQFLRQRVRGQIADLRNAPSLVVNGKQDDQARENYIQQRGNQLLAQYRRILFYKPAEEPEPKVQPGNPGNTSDLYSPKGPRGKSAETLQREQDERDRRFADQKARLEDEALSALASQTADISARARIQRQLLESSAKRQRKDIALQTDADIQAGEDPKLARARQGELEAALDATTKAQAQLIDQQEAIDKIRAANSLADSYLDYQRDILGSQESLATTQKERREIELRLLAIAKQREKQDLEAQLAEARKRDDDNGVKQAQADLSTLDQRYGLQAQSIARDTAGPLEDYMNRIPRTAVQINEALQSVEVDGLRGLDDALTNTVAKVVHLGGTFGSVADQIISDLIRIGVEKEIVGPLTAQLFGTGAGGGGGLFGSILSAIGIGSGGASVGSVLGSGFNVGSIATDIPFAFASGGSGVIGGRPGIDQNVLSINNTPVAKVGAGELLSVVNPNLGAMNQRVASPAPRQTFVTVQPIHADFRGARTDEQTMRAFVAYADARSDRARDEAIRVAGAQVGGIVQRKQTLGS